MPELVKSLLAQSSMPSGGRVLADTLRLTVLPPRSVIQLQLGARSLKTAATIRVAGRKLPEAINTWCGDDPAFCQLAPDSWWVISALHEGPDLIDAIRKGCGRRACVITELSDSQVTLALDGPRATEVIARGCGLALTAAAFGVEACTRTRLAQLPVVLRRLTQERFECLVDRSAAQYLYDWMEDAANGFC